MLKSIYFKIWKGKSNFVKPSTHMWETFFHSSENEDSRCNKPQGIVETVGYVSSYLYIPRWYQGLS